jgi:hypothetical protein
VSAQHRGGRRPWHRRVPGVLVAVLAAVSAVAVAGVALRGSGDQTAATGASGAALTLAGGGVKRSRRHRGEHRVANPSGAAAVQPVEPFAPFESFESGSSAGASAGAGAAGEPSAVPAAPSSLEVAMSTPPAPAFAAGPVGPIAAEPAPAGAALFLLPPPAEPDPMVDTVPHPVVKLFPLANLEPDRASGAIDERVYAAIDAERVQAEAAALANGRHASSRPLDAARPRDVAYRSRHSA